MNESQTLCWVNWGRHTGPYHMIPFTWSPRTEKMRLWFYQNSSCGELKNKYKDHKGNSLWWWRYFISWSADGYKVKLFVNILLNCALKISVVCHMFMITERGTFTHVHACVHRHIALGDESWSKNSAPFKLPLCAKAPEIHSHTCTDLQSLPLLCS